jgi:hypothetical protein
MRTNNALAAIRAAAKTRIIKEGLYPLCDGRLDIFAWVCYHIRPCDNPCLTSLFWASYCWPDKRTLPPDW